MASVPAARHLLRAKDFATAHYADPITVADMAAAAGLSRSHFSREFSRTFGESPRSFLQTRRLERAATLLRGTDRTVAEICMSVGFESVGSFTTSFARAFGTTPARFRAASPPATHWAMVPTCMLHHLRPPAVSRVQDGTPEEDAPVP